MLEASLASKPTGLTLYNRQWFTYDHLLIVRDVTYALILAFPLVFTLGLLPQVNTAAMYALEQVDIQLFGGNASSSLQASLYCVLRSLLVVVVMFGFAYGGLTESSHSAHAQEVLFSIFCALAVSLSYHLSRCSGDPTVVLSVMKRHFLALLTEDSEEPIVSPDSSGLQSPAEEQTNITADPLPKKLRDTVNARLKNDVILCLVSAVAVFLVHQSGVFVAAFPTLDIVLWLLAILTGFLFHYLLPHLRKQTPWKCFAAPILASHEHAQFEVRAAAKVMWWERVLLWAAVVEKSFLYPLIFLSGVTQDRPVFEEIFGIWGGSLAMTVCLMKCLRCVWSDSSKAYFTLLLAILLFQYQPEGFINNLSPTAKRHSPFLLDFFFSSILNLKLTGILN